MKDESQDKKPDIYAHVIDCSSNLVPSLVLILPTDSSEC